MSHPPRAILALWPGAVQIAACHIHYKPRHPKRKVRADEIHYYLLTGPPGARPLSARRVARLIRGHWAIEDRLHHVKDRTFREDEQRICCGAIALCWLRTAALTALCNAEASRRGRCGRKKRRRYAPEIRSYYNAHPRKAIALLRT